MSAPKKQTAVEWLTSKIADQRENGNTDLRSTLYYCEQAKAMEKEQIKDAYWNGSDGIKTKTQILNEAEQFFNETYGGNK
jgi:hypothetical protein